MLCPSMCLVTWEVAFLTALPGRYTVGPLWGQAPGWWLLHCIRPLRAGATREGTATVLDRSSDPAKKNSWRISPWMPIVLECFLDHTTLLRISKKLRWYKSPGIRFFQWSPTSQIEVRSNARHMCVPLCHLVPACSSNFLCCLCKFARKFLKLSAFFFFWG